MKEVLMEVIRNSITPPFNLNFHSAFLKGVETFYNFLPLTTLATSLDRN
jgi:hypothetical protein